jgi:Fic family protein
VSLAKKEVSLVPKRIETKEIDAVVAAVGAFPQGAPFSDIAQALAHSIHERTLQRRLAKLVKDGRIEKTGKGTKTRYRLVLAADEFEGPAEPAQGAQLAGDDDNDPKLTLTLKPSIAGMEVFNEISKPRQERKRVSYNRDFLDAYRSNETFYLPAGIRRELAAIGRVTDKVEPAGTYARHVLNRLLIELSFHSSRLEGNRYTLLETKQLIEAGRTATGKAAEETQMIINHKEAIEFLVESAELMGVNKLTIQNLHAVLSDNLMADPADSGRLRTRGVDIGGSVYLPLAVPQLIEEILIQVLNTANRISDPFEQAFFLLVHLPYLQPFQDVNKRVSRLSANIPLIRNNLKPLSFVDVPKSDYAAGLLGVYELNRIELIRDVFVWAYKRSAEHYTAIRDSLGSPDEFKLRYRPQIKSAVAFVIKNGIPAKDVQNRIGEWAEDNGVAETDRGRFVAVIEAEILSLQEWNVARYPVTPNEYKAWLASAG